MSRPAAPKPDDLGFSLIEMLVVLLIAAGLSLGVGALYRIVAEALDRRAELTAVGDALIGLHAIAGELDQMPDLDTAGIQNSGPLSIELASRSTAVAVTLGLADKSLIWTGLPYRDDGKLSLNQFDSMRFRYLVGRDALEWRDEPLPPIRAIRLDLQRDSRHWETMLWMAPGDGS